MGAKNFKFQLNRNLQHISESSKMTTRLANPLKSLKMVRNYAMNQEISVASAEMGQIGHDGGWWEIDLSALKPTKITI